MERLINVAGYIFQRYEKEHGQTIDEMKLHKLMYFSQRESFIRNDEPLFKGVFYAWKFGPILKEIRSIYINKDFDSLRNSTISVTEKLTVIFDYIFSVFANESSWSLSTLTHNEYSWKHAREGVLDNENSDNKILDSDIKIDANTIKLQRTCLGVM